MLIHFLFLNVSFYSNFPLKVEFIQNMIYAKELHNYHNKFSLK